jgi:hypothetical protein
MAPVTNNERHAIYDWPLLDELNNIAANHVNRMMINRHAGELTLDFGGDNVEANHFERLVPRFALKRRFADSVTIDLTAVEKIHGPQAFSRRRRWLGRLLWH